MMKNSTGGEFLNDVTINTDGSTADGSITLTGDIRLDNGSDNDDPGSFVVSNSNTAKVASILISPTAVSGGASLTIDTEDGGDSHAGDVDLGDATNTLVTSVDTDSIILA